MGKREVSLDTLNEPVKAEHTEKLTIVTRELRSAANSTEGSRVERNILKHVIKSVTEQLVQCMR